jgi:hypothetical protein
MPKVTAAPLTLWGKAPAGSPAALPWSWVVEQLQVTEDYWFVTAASHGPNPRPVWGLWLDDRLLLSVGSPTHVHNLRESNRVAVHLGDAHDVVIVEGTAHQETDEHELARLLPPYNQKYDWNWEPGQDIGAIFAVNPAVVLAWRAAPNEDAQTSPFPLAAGKWTFTDE